MSFHIYHSFLIQATPKQVFNAVSQPEHLNNWWSLKSSGSPELGAEYNLNFTDKYNWFCKVSKVKPYKSIYYKMTKADTDWSPTTFGFDLEKTEKGTKVHFSHTDWPEANQHFKHSSFCWALLLNGLKNYLEKGVVVPFEARS